MTARRRAKKPVTLDRVFRIALFLVPLGVAGNLALSWYTTDRSVLATLGELPRHYLLLAVVLGLAPWFTNALRIHVWMRFIGHRVSFADSMRITLGGELGSSVLPTSSGGEIFRWGMMMQRGISPGAAASVVALGHVEDSLFFLIALPLAATLSSAWDLPALQAVGRQLRGNALHAVVLVVVVIGGLWLVHRLLMRGVMGRAARGRTLRATGRLRRRLRSAWREARGVYALVIERGKIRFAATMGITAVQWICRYSVASALMAFLGAPVDPVLFFLLQWVVFTVMLFIPTPGASGGAEAAFYLVYSALVPERIIGLATAGWRLLTFYLQLSLGAVIFLLLSAAERRNVVRRGPVTGVDTDLSV